MAGTIIIKEEKGNKEDVVISHIKSNTLLSKKKKLKKGFFSIKKEFPEYNHKQLFRKKWMENPVFKDWLVEGLRPNQAFCNFCCVNISAHKTELLAHSKSKKHVRKALLAETNDLNCNVEPEDVTAIVDEAGGTHLLRIIDLRCDSLSVPTKEMRNKMVEAPCGDTSYGTDQGVIDLETTVSNMLDKEVGLFFPTHVMANMVAVLTHCQSRGSAVITGKDSDINVRNTEALIKFGGLHLCPMTEEDNGTYCLEALETSLKGLDLNFPLSAVVCYEVAHAKKGGRVPPFQWVDQLAILCSHHQNLFVHCDGTRLVNASLARNVSPSRFVKGSSSVTFALDKGLGAPVGAVLVGNKEFIRKATFIRNFIGGHIHQAGIFASAGTFALESLLTSVDLDHEKAKAIALAVAMGNCPYISVNVNNVETNIVNLRCKPCIMSAVQLKDRLASVSQEETEACDGENIIVLGEELNEEIVSLNLHNKVSDTDVRAVIKKINYIMNEEETEDKKE